MLNSKQPTNPFMTPNHLVAKDPGNPEFQNRKGTDCH